MKILLVTFSDNADHQDTLFGLYENLKDVYNTYLLAITAPKVQIEKSEHTWFVDCPKRPGIEKRTFNIFLLISIIYRIKKEKFDVIYFESLHVWNLPILMTAGKTVHTYQVIHEVIPHEGDIQVKGVDLINKVICRTTKTIILRNQKYIQNMIDQYKVDPDRIRFLELWRRYPDFTEPVYKKRVLFFGRINPYKGADNLLEIVRLCPDIQFDIVGRVDSQMITVVEMLKTERNVQLHNSYVSDDEMRKAFTNCDWVIVPYNSASQSGIIIDAYKYSRPVIAFKVGAIAEQVDDGKSGYLVNARDNQAFAYTLKKAISLDSSAYHAMCQYAFQFGSKKYSASGAVNRFVHLMEEETL